MNKLQHALILIGIILLQSLPMQAAESLSVLLQKGIFAEETEGNLDAAIQIYEGIVQESEANRSLIAQAQFRLGVCELKRGKKEEAEAAFRKIIGRFPDQTEISAKARERLGELGKSASSVVVRQVWSGKEAAGDSVSSDGRNLAFIDWDTGNLAVRDLLNGVNRRLALQGSWEIPLRFVESCALSPDGKRIAYAWYEQTRETNFSYGLHLLNLGDSKSRVIVGQETNFWISAEDWSPDGESVAVFDAEKKGTNWLGAISLIRIADGSKKKIVAEDGNASTLRFSPDGRYLAYNLARHKQSGPRSRTTNDIVVVDIQTGSRRIAVENVADEKLVGWAPRGSEILFTSQRRGSTDLWSRKVGEPETPSQARLLKADLGDIQPIGLTRQGAFFYSSEVGKSLEIFTASVDFEAGKMLSAPKRVKSLFQPARMVSNKIVPSADRRFLYFCSGYKEPAAYILDLESGQEREIEKSRAWAGRIGWWWPSTDNSTLAVALQGPEKDRGLHRLNPQTGEINPLALDKPGIRQAVDNPIRLHSSRDFMAFSRLYANPKKFVLVKHDLKLGVETEHEIPGLASDPIPQKPESHRNRALLLSDGRTFLFNRKLSSANSYTLIQHDLVTSVQKEFSSSKSPIGVVDTLGDDKIFVVTTDERERSVFSLVTIENAELRRSHQVTVPEGFKYRGQHWTEPHLILIKPNGKEDGELAEMWTLSVRSGELKSLGLSVPNDQWFGLAAGAKSLHYQMTSPGTRDIWVMENFLPGVASAK